MSAYTLRILGKDGKQEVIDLKPGQKWVSITQGMSGWFAVLYWLNNEDVNLGCFPEPWDTGFGRYETRQLAYNEAKEMASEDSFPLEHLAGVN